MDRNTGVKISFLLSEAVESLKRKLRADDGSPEEFVFRIPPDDEVSDEPRICPYSPDSHRILTESSLHMSC